MKTGYSYHIKDCFFEEIGDPSMMSNKENGGYRPHFVCIQDASRSSLFWAVPISSRIEKYRTIAEKKAARYGECDTIVIGRFAGRDAAFLIQNMFPITEQYVDHIHTVDNVPVVLHEGTQREIRAKAERVLAIYRRTPTIIFTDIERILRILGY